MTTALTVDTQDEVRSLPVDNAAANWFFALLLGAPGLFAAALATYLLAVTGASFFYRPERRPPWATRRLDVLIPAHNEAGAIGPCIGSLLSQSYPQCLYRIVVIADNCTDHTAALAAALGVDVMVRTDLNQTGKGHALRWAIDQILAEPAPPDAFVIVDADSAADRNLLTELAGELNVGHEVVQAEYLAQPGVGGQSQLAATAFLLFHRVRFSGRAALGMPVQLVGNGMLLSRRVLEEHPWDAFSSVEDREYSLRLRLAGVRPVFAGGARVYAPVASGGRDEWTQRRRWEGGRLFLMRHWLGRLVAAAITRHDWRLLDEVIDLAVPPLGLFALVVMAGTGASVLLAAHGVLSPWAAAPWIVAAIAIPVHIVAGLRAARAPAPAYWALLQAPYFLLRKVGMYASLVRSFDVRHWEPADQGSAPATPGR